jgi:hypothetical protein
MLSGTESFQGEGVTGLQLCYGSKWRLAASQLAPTMPVIGPRQDLEESEQESVLERFRHGEPMATEVLQHAGLRHRPHLWRSGCFATCPPTVTKGFLHEALPCPTPFFVGDEVVAVSRLQGNWATHLLRVPTGRDDQHVNLLGDSASGAPFAPSPFTTASRSPRSGVANPNFLSKGCGESCPARGPSRTRRHRRPTRRPTRRRA